MKQAKAGKPAKPAQRSLLDVEERAVLLAELDRNEGGGGAKEGKRGQNVCRRCGWCWLCCDIGSISIMFTVILILVGVVLLVVVRVLGWPIEVDQLARYIISAGVFGLITGGTNAVALFMLLYKIPLVCGSGVFYRRHNQIKNVIKLIVLQQLFSSEHLQDYISKKIRQFSSHVQVTENITTALNSAEMAQIINRRLDLLFSEPEAQLLHTLGVSRRDVESVIRPAVLSLCAETAPYVLDNVQQSQFGNPKAISVPRFRKEVDLYLSWRLEELTQQHMGSLMRELLQVHLGWVVVWGCVVGALSGIITQGVRVSLNFNFFPSQ